MKHFIPFILFLFISVSAFAQVTVTIEPNPYIGSFDQVDLNDFWSEYIAEAHFVNTSNQTVSFRWELEVIEAPEEWEYRVCDNNQCYNTNVYSNYIPGELEEPVTLEPGDTSLLKLQLLPRQVVGNGTIHIIISDYDNLGDQIDTAVYEITVPTSVYEEQLSKLRLFPNPAVEYFSLDGSELVDQLIVYNTLGKQVRVFDVYDGARFAVGGLPDGVYLVSLFSFREGVMKTLLLSKRAYRP